MKELERRRKTQKKLYSSPVLIVLALVTILLAKGAYGVLIKAHTSTADVAALTTQVSALSQKELELKDDIARLKTDRGVDEEIKEKFNVSADGEHVAIVIDKKGPAATSTSTTTRAWYTRAWNAIISSL